MQRWRGLDEIPGGWGASVVTIGTFDGVHRGHAALIGTAVQAAAAAGLPSVVLTFDPHPVSVVRPGTHPAVLTTPVRRAELIEALGVDVLLVVPFTPAFAALSPEEFARTVLADGLHAAEVVVGENFTFGHRAAGDVAELERLGRALGFTVRSVGLVAADDPISASAVRAMVAAGDVAGAARALGRPFRVDGTVVMGDQRGRLLGYPTANLQLAPHTAVPADGVYAGRVDRLDDLGATVGPLRPAAISVGTNPTFDGTERRVEAFLLDFDGDLYGQQLGIEFAHRLRGMAKFDDVDALVAQMGADVARTRELVS